MQTVLDFFRKYGVKVALVGTAIAVSVGWATCSFDTSTKDVDVKLDLPVEDPAAPVQDSNSDNSTETSVSEQSETQQG